jgi:hypothetical protein
MKLINLIPLKEIDFRNQDQFDSYNKQHKLRPDTKVTIAGKPTTAGKAAQNSEPAKGSSVFGKDSSGSVFGDTPSKVNRPSVQLPNKASKLNYKHAESLEKAVNAETGLKGYVDTDDNTDAIMYNASKGNQPTYTLYFGGNDDYGKPDEFRVSLLPTYGNDPANVGDKVDKTFKSGDEAMKFMVDTAKKYKKELEMDDSNN